jgi:ATP-binding cassette, subfamily B, heavy metal transporter
MSCDLTALSDTTSAGMAPDRRAVQRLKSIVWPAGDPAIRRRLVVTVALLLGAALLNALVPLLFARAVDHFAATGTDAFLAAAPLGLLAAQSCSAGVASW